MSLSFSVFNKGSLINVVGAIVARSYRKLNRRPETKEEVSDRNQSPILACSQLGRANPLKNSQSQTDTASLSKEINIPAQEMSPFTKVTLESRRQIQICLEVEGGGVQLGGCVMNKRTCLWHFQPCAPPLSG